MDWVKITKAFNILDLIQGIMIIVSSLIKLKILFDVFKQFLVKIIR